MRHQREQLDHRRDLPVAAILPVESVDIHRDPFAIAPARKITQRDIQRGLTHGQSGIEPLAGLPVDISQVIRHAADTGLVRDRTVPRHNDVHIHRDDRLAGADPVCDRPRPHQRRAIDEQDVAREHRLVPRHMHQHIAAGMRRTHLDQPHRLVTDLHVHRAGKGLRRRALLDIFEIKRRKHIREVSACRAKLCTRRLEHGQRRRRHLGHFPRARLAGNDFRLRTTSVAMAMVAVRMRVDDGGDLARADPGRILHRGQHVPRQGHVEKRIDQQ